MSSKEATRTAALEVFLEDYNWVRTHSAIGNRPPASRLPVNNVTGNYTAGSRDHCNESVSR
jgi:transposase InsO family protein